MTRPQAAALWSELSGWTFACERCGWQVASEHLATLPRLLCRCGAPLGPLRVRPDSGSFPLPGADLGSRGPADSDFVGQAFGSGVRQVGVVPGGVLGPYRIARELGRGANGAVFLASRADREGSFALKVLLEGTIQDAETIARFQLEAAIGSKLKDPGVVKVHDVGRVGDQLYYAMEYSPGKTLKELLREGGRLPWREAAELVSQLALTLAHCHENSVIHRDVKPGNVILDEALSRPRLTDFGLARDRTLAETMTQSGDWLGTPYYMSPEQFLGQTTLDHRIDIYALGVILYETLTGERPYVAKTATELMDLVLASDAPRPQALVPDLPPGLDAICRRAMANHREDRYSSGRELAVALQQVLAGVNPAPTRGGGQGRLIAGLAVGLAALFALAGALYAVRARAGQAAAAPSASAGPSLLPSLSASAAPSPDPEARWSELLAQPSLWSGELDLARALAGFPRDAQARERREALGALFELLGAARRAAPWADLGLILQRARASGEWPAYQERLQLVEARLLIARGRSAEALKRLGREREEPRARWLRLEACAAQGQTEQARALLRALSEDPGPVGSLARARGLRLGGKLEEALKAARGAGAFPGARLEEAQVLGAQKLYQAAEAALEAHAKVWGRGPSVLSLEGDIALERGELQPALELYARAAKLLEVDRWRELDLRRARLILRLGDPAAARALLDGILPASEEAKIGSPEVEPLVLRGVARFELGDPAGAERDWRRARVEDTELSEAAWPSFASAKAKAALPGGGSREEEPEVNPFAELFAAEKPTGRLMPLGQLPRPTQEALEARAEVSPIERDLSRARMAAADGRPWESVRFILGLALERRVERERVRALWFQLALGRGGDLEKLAQRLGGDVSGYGLSPSQGELAGALVAWCQGRAGEALEGFTALREREGATPEGLAAGAYAAFLRADFRQTKTLADALLAKAPSSRAYALRGLAELALGQADQAAKSQAAGYAVDGASDHFLLALRACLNADAEQESLRESAQSLVQLQAGCEQTELLALRVLLESDKKGERHFLRGRFVALVDVAGAELEQLRGYAWVRRGKEPALCLKAWRSARALDPALPLPPPYLEAFRVAFGPSEELDALR